MNVNFTKPDKKDKELKDEQLKEQKLTNLYLSIMTDHRLTQSDLIPGEKW